MYYHHITQIDLICIYIYIKWPRICFKHVEHACSKLEGTRSWSFDFYKMPSIPIHLKEKYFNKETNIATAGKANLINDHIVTYCLCSHGNFSYQDSSSAKCVSVYLNVTLLTSAKRPRFLCTYKNTYMQKSTQSICMNVVSVKLLRLILSSHLCVALMLRD